MMKTLVAAAALLLLLQGCYSFTGSSVPPHLKTIAIPLLDDQSGTGEPGLREKLTNRIIDRFRQDNSLEVADRSRADALLEGTITALPDQPQVIAAGETVTKHRITLMVHVNCQDMKLKKKMYDKDFSSIGDYDAGTGPAGRQAAIDAAVDKVAEDILLATVAGW